MTSSDPNAAPRAWAEEMVRLVRDPRQWGMGREYELSDVFFVWAWAEARQEIAIMAALARVVAIQHLYRVGVTGVDPTGWRRFSDPTCSPTESSPDRRPQAGHPGRAACLR